MKSLNTIKEQKELMEIERLKFKLRMDEIEKIRKRFFFFIFVTLFSFSVIGYLAYLKYEKYLKECVAKPGEIILKSEMVK